MARLWAGCLACQVISLDHVGEQFCPLGDIKGLMHDYAKLKFLMCVS